MDGKLALCEKILLDHGVDIFTCCDDGDSRWKLQQTFTKM
jgi:hypothetical protein